jgi:predicted kinase
LIALIKELSEAVSVGNAWLPQSHQRLEPNVRGMNPGLVVIAGPPCSGKSTLGRALARRFDCLHLEMDAIRAATFPIADHGKAVRRKAYATMHATAETLLRCGWSIILDATYGPSEERSAVERLSARTRADLFLVECFVSSATALDRYSRRDARHPAVDLDADRVIQLAAEYPYFEGGIVIEASADGSIGWEVEEYLRRGVGLGRDSGWSESAVGRWQ